MSLDPHPDLHVQMVRRAPVPRALQCNCVARVLHDSDADEVLVSHNAC